MTTDAKNTVARMQWTTGSKQPMNSMGTTMMMQYQSFVKLDLTGPKFEILLIFCSDSEYVRQTYPQLLNRIAIIRIDQNGQVPIHREHFIESRPRYQQTNEHVHSLALTSLCSLISLADACSIASIEQNA